MDISVRIDWKDPEFPVWVSINGDSPKCTSFLTRDFRDKDHLIDVLSRYYSNKYGSKNKVAVSA